VNRFLVAGGRVVAPGGIRAADVLVEDGVVVEVGAASADEVLDATGCFVLPGGIDPHTHALGQIGEASRCAAFGGTTTTLAFSDTGAGEGPVAALARGEEQVGASAIDVGLHAKIWEPELVTREQLAEAKAHGALGVKLFTCYREWGIMTSDRRLYEIARDCAELGLLLMVHCENGDLIDALAAEHGVVLEAGVRPDPRDLAVTRPPVTESEAVFRVLALAGLAGAETYLVHLTTAESLEHVRRARARGQVVHAEVNTHHLTFDESAGHMSVPPLRPREHVEALWAGVADGTVDTLGTDHHHHAGPGLRGLEVRLPLFLSEGARRGIPLERLVDVACAAPARIFRQPGKGRIEAGADADLVLWDPDARWAVRVEALHDGFGTTAYDGIDVEGRVRAVLLRGELLVRDGELYPGAGGRYLPV